MYPQDSTSSGTTAHTYDRDSAVLVVCKPPADRGRYVVLARDTTVVGREDTSDLVLTDPSASRRHAAIRMRDGKYVIEDLASLNGTFLNGERVTVRRALRDGDELKFGRTVVEFSQSGDRQRASKSAGPAPGSWRPSAPTQPIGRGRSLSGRHPDHTLRADLHAAPSFSRAALLLAVLGSVVGAVLLSSLGEGPWWRLAGAAVGPVISTTFTTRQAGEKGRIRAAIMVLLSSAALLITVTGTSLTEFARGTPVLSQADEGTSTFPVPGLSERMSEHESGGTDGPEAGIAGIDADHEVVECEPALVGQEVECGAVSIASTGDEPLTIELLDLQGHANDFWGALLCTPPLEPGESCEVLIAFTPTEPGDREAVLVIAHDAPGAAVEVTLLGSALSERGPDVG